MNSWLDYGFTPAQFSPGSFDPRTPGAPSFQQTFGFPGVGVPQTQTMFPVTYALQAAPAIATYARQPFASSAVVGNGYAAPYGISPFQVLGAPALPVAAWQQGLQEPSTLRPIGFQPPITAAGTLPQFQQVLSRIPTDDEIEGLISEVLDADPLLSGNAEIVVRCESGQVTLTGTVQHKRIKHAIGEIAWSVPGIVDVRNNLELASRRRLRAGLRKEGAQASGQQRK